MFSANSNQSGGVDATTDPYFNSTTLLLSGDGTNGAHNNTFVDSSVNNATITRGNTPTQGSFSPFSQTGWSGYFNGSSSNLQIASNAALAVGAGDFTIEMWVYSTSTTNRLISYGIANSPILYINGSNFVQYDNYGTAVLQTSSIAVPLNAWSHVALVRLASTSKIYINGVQASTSGVGADSTNYVQSGVYIGVDVATTFMTGYLSNLRVVKGVAVYTGAFTPPTAPLSRTQSAGTNILALSGTETNLLTLQDNRFKDNSTNNFTITAVGTPSVQAFSPFAPTATYSLPAAAAGSAYFNGTNNSLVIPASALWEFGSGAFTVECWVRLNAVGVLQYIAFHGWAGSGGYNFGWHIQINASNQLQFYVNGDSRAFTDIVMSADTWTHLAVTGSAGVLSAYKNGVKSVTTWSYPSFVAAASNTLVIGAYNNNNANAAERLFYKGYISNFRIVKGTAVYTGNFTPSGTPLSKIQSAGTNIAALSGTETSILTLQDSTFKDNSTNVVTITASATPPVIQSFTPFTQVWGGNFDGSGYYLTVPTNAVFNFGAGAYTVEMWIYPTIFPSVSAQLNMFQMGTHVGGGNFLEFGLYNDAGSVKLTYQLYNTSYKIVVQTQVLPSTNKWYHIAMIFTGSTAYTSLDGILSTGVAYSGSDAPTGQTVYIGAYNASIPYFTGYMSNLRVVKGVAVYTGAFTPPAKTLSATQAAGTNISAIYPGQTSLLTLQDPTFKDNATLPNTITAAGTLKAQLVSAPFTSAATVDPVNGSGYFDGSSNLLVPSGAPFNLTTVDFCIEMWVYPIAQSQYGALLSFDAQDYPLMFQWAAAGSANIRFYAGSSTAWISGTPLDFGTTVLNTWAHICVTRTSGVFRTFKNGVLSTVLAGQESFSIGASVGSVYVGSNGAAGGFSTAYISNLRIIKGTSNVPAAYQTSSTTLGTAIFQPPTTPLTAVTGTSLLTLQDTTFIDKAGISTITTSATPPAMRAFTPFASNWGGYFDGNGGATVNTTALTITDNAQLELGNSDFTFECWVYLTASPSVGVRILDKDAVNQTSYFFYINSTSNPAFAFSTDGISVTGLAATSTISINAWKHLAITRSGTTFTFWINGNSAGTSTNNVTIYNGTASAFIGNASSNDRSFPGYVSNLRIVKGTAVYTTNFQPPSAPLTAISGSGYSTSLLTLQNNTFIDNSSNAATITVVGAPKTQLLQLPFTSSITKVAAPWNISVTAPLATVGGSMYFDGSSYLSVPATSNFAFGLGNFTVECYIYGNSTTFGSGAICAPNAYNGGTTFWAMLVGGGNVTWQYNHGNANLFSVSAVAYYNTWLHVAVVRSSNTTGNTTKMYFNGVQVGTGAENENYASTTTYAIARNGDGPYNMGAGYISNLRVVKGIAVYTGNFTPPTAPPQPTQTPGLLGSNVNAIDGTNSSLLLLGSNSGIYDATAKNDIITVGNAQVSSTQIKYGTGAMYFDGTGDYLNIPASTMFGFGTGDFTIEMWVYFNSISSYQVLVGQFVSGTSYWAFNIGNGTSSGGIFTYNPGNGQVIVANEGSQAAWLANTWYHTTVVRSGTTVTIYRNGSSIATGNLYGSLYNPSSNISIGSAGVLASGYLNGYIDDLRITKGIARYTTNFTPPTKAMIGQ